MRPSLPDLGPSPQKNPLGLVIAVALTAGMTVGGYWWWKHRQPLKPPELAVAPLADAGIPPVPQAPAKALTPEDVLAANGLQRASVKVEGPLETTLIGAAGPEVGPALAQVVNRSLVWWVEVPRELVRGDALDVLYEPRANEEPRVHAVRFTSQKTGQTHRAYRFQAEGEALPRFYLPTGEELEQRLEHAPIDDYEQVTSLLRDGRRHKGVDFRTPVGTPVKAPFNAVVVRKNWSFRGNGNCLELRELGGKGRRALFLHLSELPRSLKVGTPFSRGSTIALSGNSGRSFAPHLHYQLMTGDNRVLDPYESHRTYRQALKASQRPSFDVEVRRLDTLLGLTLGMQGGHPVLDTPPPPG